MERHHSLAEARAAKETLASRLNAHSGVTSIGIGSGKTNDDWALIVTLRDKEAGTSIPSDVDGVPVRLRVTGPISAF